MSNHKVGSTAPRPATGKTRGATSEKKIVSNRKNSLRSTGPQSDLGKRAVAGNAVRHGVVSEKICVMAGETMSEFEALEAKLLCIFNPEDHAEAQVVDRLAVLVWKLRRCLRARDLLGSAGQNDRWRCLDRYERSLNAQLRVAICDVYRLRNVRRN